MNVLILSGVASAINYIQSLSGDDGLKLFVSDCDPYCPGFFAPGVVPVPLPRARNTATYRAALMSALEEHAIDVLIPTSDYDVEATLLWLRDGWSPKVRLFRPNWESYGYLGYKDNLAHRLATDFPQSIPRTFGLDCSPDTLPYPVVLKPRNMSGGKGVSIVSSPEAYRSAKESLRAVYGDDVMVQEFIPGSTYVLTMLYDLKGRAVVCVGMRSHLTFFTWGGGGCAGELVDEPELTALAQAMVAKAGGWSGPINLEFRRHEPSGRFVLMEANCRLNGYSYLTTMNGINLPRLTLDALLGRPVVQPPLPRPEERRNFIIGYRERLVDAFPTPHPMA